MLWQYKSLFFFPEKWRNIDNRQIFIHSKFVQTSVSELVFKSMHMGKYYLKQVNIESLFYVEKVCCFERFLRFYKEELI